ncbi:hypothetical protein Lal_00024025 [Lupinus albus]|nr:hypothetical protein Lal_00024025 [Lupinus albus]
MWWFDFILPYVLPVRQEKGSEDYPLLRLLRNKWFEYSEANALKSKQRAIVKGPLSIEPLIPWSFLVGYESELSPNYIPEEKKSFAQAVKSSCDFSLSQLPQPCIKGDAIAIKIPEAEYQAGLQRCKNHLHGRLILSKGDTPIKFADLKGKLLSLWGMIGKWSMISLGKGFYEFSFDSVEDMRSVCAIGSWNLKPGGIGTPISLDAATNNRTFGHFAKVLVDINLKAKLLDQILVEREGFDFFVYIEYENLPEFCVSCQSIGHLASNCRRTNKREMVEDDKSGPKQPVEKMPKPVKINELFINLDIEKGEDLQHNLVVEHKDDQNNLEKVGAPQIVVEEDSSDVELSITRVENSIEGVPCQRENDFVVQTADEMGNQTAVKDLRIVGSLWASEEVKGVEEAVDEDCFISPVLSKSRKKRNKKRNMENRVHFIRRG